MMMMKKNRKNVSYSIYLVLQSTDSGQGETAPHHFGRKDTGGKDKQKKGKNGGKDKKQAKKDGQPLSPSGQPSDSSGATPKKQSFKVCLSVERSENVLQ